MMLVNFYINTIPVIWYLTTLHHILLLILIFLVYVNIHANLSYSKYTPDSITTANTIVQKYSANVLPNLKTNSTWNRTSSSRSLIQNEKCWFDKIKKNSPIFRYLGVLVIKNEFIRIMCNFYCTFINYH